MNNIVVLLIALLAFGCSEAALQKAKSTAVDINDNREIVCALLKVAAEQGSEEAQKALKACEAEADVREIAGTYAGCEVPKESE